LSSLQWYALYTKPRSEKTVAQQLHDLGIEVYCPLVETVKVWSDRKKKVKEPLFKSYVFVRISEAQRERVFMARGVVRFVYWLGKPALVRDQEILAIKDFLSETSAMTGLRTVSFEYMQELNIIQGPLKGTRGKFLYRNKSRLILQIESLGISIKAELHQSQVA
jgi:transcription antitermination factor NusG